MRTVRAAVQLSVQKAKKGGDFGRIFDSGRGFDAGRQVDAGCADFKQCLADIADMQAAGEENGQGAFSGEIPSQLPVAGFAGAARELGVARSAVTNDPGARKIPRSEAVRGLTQSQCQPDLARQAAGEFRRLLTVQLHHIAAGLEVGQDFVAAGVDADQDFFQRRGQAGAAESDFLRRHMPRRFGVVDKADGIRAELVGETGIFRIAESANFDEGVHGLNRVDAASFEKGFASFDARGAGAAGFFAAAVTSPSVFDFDAEAKGSADDIGLAPVDEGGMDMDGIATIEGEDAVDPDEEVFGAIPVAVFVLGLGAVVDFGGTAGFGASGGQGQQGHVAVRHISRRLGFLAGFKLGQIADFGAAADQGRTLGDGCPEEVDVHDHMLDDFGQGLCLGGGGLQLAIVALAIIERQSDDVFDPEILHHVVKEGGGIQSAAEEDQNWTLISGDRHVAAARSRWSL